MAASSAELHEPGDSLRAETIERHRATVSSMEELEAIDWYDQRIDASGDGSTPADRGVLEAHGGARCRTRLNRPSKEGRCKKMGEVVTDDPRSNVSWSSFLPWPR